MSLRNVSWIIPALLAVPLEGQWRDLTGEAVPDITARRWLNTNGEEPSRDTLKGRVWLLEFFGTW